MAIPRTWLPRAEEIIDVLRRMKSKQLDRAAIEELNRAVETFRSVAGNNPDGTLAYRNANVNLSKAADEYRAALRDFLIAGGHPKN